MLADDELVAAIETDQEVWSNRLRITELWVREKYQKQGIGHALVEIAKEQARRERRQAIMLETQSCNVNAVDFYQHKDYLPELSRIAVKDGQIIGCIMYSKSRVVDGADTHEIITFGPLCVEPKWQGSGVGELLLRETMSLAADKGYKGIVIFGEPDYFSA